MRFLKRLFTKRQLFNVKICFTKFINLTHRSHGVTLPLRNGKKKRTVVFNTLRYSDKELQSSFSKNVWPFKKLTDLCFPYAKMQAKLEENGCFQAVFKL